MKKIFIFIISILFSVSLFSQIKYPSFGITGSISQKVSKETGDSTIATISTEFFIGNKVYAYLAPRANFIISGFEKDLADKLGYYPYSIGTIVGFGANLYDGRNISGKGSTFSISVGTGFDFYIPKLSFLKNELEKIELGGISIDQNTINNPTSIFNDIGIFEALVDAGTYIGYYFRVPFVINTMYRYNISQSFALQIAFNFGVEMAFRSKNNGFDITTIDQTGDLESYISGISYGISLGLMF